MSARTYIASYIDATGPACRIIRVTSLAPQEKVQEAVQRLLADMGITHDDLTIAPRGANLDSLTDKPYKVHYLTVY